MRNLLTKISILSIGIQGICQDVKLIVRGETLRSLCAHSSIALARCAGRLLRDLRPMRWHRCVGTPWTMATMRTAGCFAVVKQQERYPRVTGFRSVG